MCCTSCPNCRLHGITHYRFHCRYYLPIAVPSPPLHRLSALFPTFPTSLPLRTSWSPSRPPWALRIPRYPFLPVGPGSTASNPRSKKIFLVTQLVILSTILTINPFVQQKGMLKVFWSARVTADHIGYPHLGDWPLHEQEQQEEDRDIKKKKKRLRRDRHRQREQDPGNVHGCSVKDTQSVMRLS